MLSVDEKTSVQPRTRLAPTLPAQPGRPVQIEHEYKRKGAVNVFAAFDTRTGRVYEREYQRKRQREFIDFLEFLDRSIPESVTMIHVLCDNVSTHHGKEVRNWLEGHPRFRFHFTPVHRSWMNQVEQWFGILQRTLLKASNFADIHDLKDKIQKFAAQWNEVAMQVRIQDRTSLLRTEPGRPRV